MIFFVVISFLRFEYRRERFTMDPYNRNNGLSYPIANGIDIQSVMRQVFIWMALGLLVTAFMAYLTVNTTLVNLAFNPVVLIIAIVAEFGVVLAISWGFNKISAVTATLLFFGYAALNGFTLSIVLLAFSNISLFIAFAITATLFISMAIIGYTTKVDLSKMGTFLMMGLIGIVITMVVNMFLNSGSLDTIISFIGVLIFTGLTAFDTQRIGRMASQMDTGEDNTIKFGIFGALKLYLDFINMFLFVLRFTGRRR